MDTKYRKGYQPNWHIGKQINNVNGRNGISEKRRPTRYEIIEKRCSGIVNGIRTV